MIEHERVYACRMHDTDDYTVLYPKDKSAKTCDRFLYSHVRLSRCSLSNETTMIDEETNI